MDSNLIGTIFSGISMVLSGGAALGVAYFNYKNTQLQTLIRQGTAVSESNAAQLVTVSNLGRANANAIEHTRVQNVRLASAVEVTKTQNDEIATNVGHLHICVETKVAELKEAVEKMPDAVKEAVPDAIKEAIPTLIEQGNHARP